MKPFPLPVVTLGQGHQPDEDASPDFPSLPSGMDTFAPPRMPRGVPPQTSAAGLACLNEILAAMRGTTFAEAHTRQIVLHGRPREALAFVDAALGEGEVAARIEADPACGRPALRVQETAFAGLWRLLGFDAQGGCVEDRIAFGAAPAELIEAGRRHERLVPPVPLPEAGLMNAPAVLHEVSEAARAHRDGRAPAGHVIDLTLLPMSPADRQHLATALGQGPVVILSRGYGNCRITRSLLADTWWVQYFNDADTLILDSLEVCALPAVAAAAEEDFADSLVRLTEWIAALEREQATEPAGV